MGISTILQKPLAIPFHSPNSRNCLSLVLCKETVKECMWLLASCGWNLRRMFHERWCCITVHLCREAAYQAASPHRGTVMQALLITLFSALIPRESLAEKFQSYIFSLQRPCNVKIWHFHHFKPKFYVAYKCHYLMKLTSKTLLIICCYCFYCLK